MNYFDILLAKKLEDDRDPKVEGLSVSENGRYHEDGVVYDPVIVNVPQTPLSKLTVTENGTYTAPTGTAYNEVEVDVPLPENAYLLKDIPNTPTAIATFSDGSDLPMPKLKCSIDSACNGAKVINSSDGVINSDNAPYTYRATPYNDANVLETIVGGTVAWNQLVNTTDTSCTVPNAHKYIFHHGTTYDVAISDGNAFTVDGSANDNVHDITQAFGSTIADYIYSLEQAEEGSGIAWLKSYGFLTKDYYAYDSGSLQSVNVASRKVYDSNDTLVATYPLDSDLTLRGIPKLDANNNLFYDGDVYESDGTVTRKYGIVDLGTLGWTYNASTFNGSFSATLNGMLQNTAGSVCAKYQSVSSSLGSYDKAIYTKNNGNQVWVRDTAYTDAPTFTTAMSGVYLVYELATPTSETADAYENPQLVGSTEEFVDAGTSASTPTRDVDIPCGHNSLYYNGNGYYVPFPTTISSGTYDVVDGTITSGQDEYNVNPLGIKSQQGINNVFADTGDVLEASYWEEL